MRWSLANIETTVAKSQARGIMRPRTQADRGVLRQRGPIAGRHDGLAGLVQPQLMLVRARPDLRPMQLPGHSPYLARRRHPYREGGKSADGNADHEGQRVTA